jgi:hypothetical protein
VDKRRANALETLHDYIASKLNPGYDTDRWNQLREPWEGEMRAHFLMVQMCVCLWNMELQALFDGTNVRL